MDAQTTTHGFSHKKLGRSYPHRNHDYYGNHSNSSVLQAMADRPKLPARTSDAKTKHLKIQVFSETMNKSRKYPDECFPDPKINKPFTMNKEFLIYMANQLP